MFCLIVQEAFDPLEQVAKYQKQFGFEDNRIGATSIFIGTMRDFNDDAGIDSMFLDHYSGMAEKALNEIGGGAVERWGLSELLIVHRVGLIYPGEPIVTVATWSSHRAHAFESCRHVMDLLKSNAPFWKKEFSKTGDRWVLKNTAGTTDL